MPAQNELSRRWLLTLGAGAGLSLLGCSAQTPTPDAPQNSPPDTATKETPKPDNIQPAIATAEPVRNITPQPVIDLSQALTVVATHQIPVNPTQTSSQSTQEALRPTFPTPILRQATPAAPELSPTAFRQPTPEIKTLNRGVVWEEKTVETPLGRLDGARGPLPPSFSWNKNGFFITNKDNIPAQIDFDAATKTKTTKELWRWTGKGYVIGQDSDTVYILNKEAFRIYAINIKSKNEVWRYNLPENFMEAPRDFSGKPNTYEVKWPLFTSDRLVGIQFLRGYLLWAKGTDNALALRGKLVKVFGNQALTTNPFAGNENIWTVRAYDPKRDWVELSQINSKGDPNGLADEKSLIIASPDPKDSTAFPSTSLAWLIDLETWNASWPITTLKTGSLTPIHLSQDLVVFGSSPRYTQYNPSIYYILNRKNGTIVDSVQGQTGVVWDFFSKDGWLFASNQQGGTIAFKKEGKIWQNEDLGGALKCLTEIDGNLILTRGGSTSILGGKPDFAGALWSVNAKTGRRTSWDPVFFDQFTTSSLLVGNFAVVADGIFGSRFALNAVDLKTGNKDVLHKPSYAITHLEDTGVNQIVLGQTVNEKLFAVKV